MWYYGYTLFERGNMMDNAKLVERIQKLLELGDATQNNSDTEAKEVLLKAHELMAKYNLSKAEINAKKEKTNEFVFTDCDTPQRARFQIYLSNVIANAFRCKAAFYGRGKYVTMFGLEEDTIAAKLAYEFAAVQLKKCSARMMYGRKKNGLPTGGGVYNTYVDGFIIGLKDELDKQCVALKVLPPEGLEDKYMEKVTGKPVTINRRESTADINVFNQGYKDGSNLFAEQKRVEA